MKAQKNNHPDRKILWLLPIVIGGCLLLLGVFGVGTPKASPLKTARTPVVRGEKIEPEKLAPSDSSNAVVTAVSPASQASVAVLSSNIPAAQPPDGDEKYLPVSFARLSSYQYKVTDGIADAMADPANVSQKSREQFPNTVKVLSEKQVAITGFMLPVRVNDGLVTDFLLLKSQSACCYGVMPRVNEWVIVRIAGKGVKSVMDVPVTALGTFHVGEQRDNGALLGIYGLDCDRVIEIETPTTK